MGHCYDSRGRLVCDQCGEADGTAKARHCTYKVLTDSIRGGRASLHYCYPPDLCKGCYEALKPTLHGEECKTGAARSQADYDHTEALLDQGEYFSITGFGDWHELVPEGYVGRCFKGRKGEKWVLIPKDDDKSNILSEIKTAKPWSPHPGETTKEQEFR
jgi:hypothetical protein